MGQRGQEEGSAVETAMDGQTKELPLPVPLVTTAHTRRHGEENWGRKLHGVSIEKTGMPVTKATGPVRNKDRRNSA